MTDANVGSGRGLKQWGARLLKVFVVLFLLVDGVVKVLRLDVAVEGTVELGYPGWLVPWIGLVLIVCVVLFVIPRTSILGAILLTGYLGGAVATHVGFEDPWFLFPAAFGVLAWATLYLEDDPRLRALLPLRSDP